jgi:hypothetical protein
MYSSEHGPSNDDEVNIIEKARNYGWPEVMGYCSEPEELQFCSDSNVVEPIAAWTPTLAVAGTDFYHHAAIPEWKNSLLVTSLKASVLTALSLSTDGRSVIMEEMYFEDWFGRLRDLCISPDGRIFLAVSNLDGRGDDRPGDDRIVEIAAKNSGPLEIRPGSEGNIRVYPNPVSGNKVQLQYSLEKEAQLRIYSQDGKEISRSILFPGNRQVSIQLPETSGIYNLIISSQEGTSHLRVLKL